MKKSVFLSPDEAYCPENDEYDFVDTSDCVQIDFYPPEGVPRPKKETWKYELKENTLQPWYLKEVDELRARRAFEDWAKKHVFFTGAHIIKDAQCFAYGDSYVIARGKSVIEAKGRGQVIAHGMCAVMAYDKVVVSAYGNSKVYAYDNTSVMAYDDGQVVAYDAATVKACHRSVVAVYGRSTVEVWGGESKRDSKDSSDSSGSYRYCTISAFDDTRILKHENCACTLHGRAFARYY